MSEVKVVARSHVR